MEASTIIAIINLVITLIGISYWFGKYAEKINNLEKNSASIQDLRERLAKVEAGKANISSQYFQANSPLSLTDKGKAVLLDSSGKDYIEKNKDVLLKQIKERSPKNAYDVQEYSIDIIKSKTQLDDFNPIKNYAFKEGLDFDLVIKILGIYLRDFALIDNGFNINEL